MNALRDAHRRRGLPPVFARQARGAEVGDTPCFLHLALQNTLLLLSLPGKLGIDSSNRSAGNRICSHRNSSETSLEL